MSVRRNHSDMFTICNAALISSTEITCFFLSYWLFSPVPSGLFVICVNVSIFPTLMHRRIKSSPFYVNVSLANAMDATKYHWSDDAIVIVIAKTVKTIWFLSTKSKTPKCYIDLLQLWASTSEYGGISSRRIVETVQTSGIKLFLSIGIHSKQNLYILFSFCVTSLRFIIKQ